MPFATVERTSKRIRADDVGGSCFQYYVRPPSADSIDEDDIFYLDLFNQAPPQSQQRLLFQPKVDNNTNGSNNLQLMMFKGFPSSFAYDTTSPANENPTSFSNSPSTPLELDSSSSSSSSNIMEKPLSPTQTSPPCVASEDENNSNNGSVVLETTTNSRISAGLSRLHFSYTECGINVEAQLSSVSDLRSLIDAFSQLCSTTGSDGLSIAAAAAANNNNAPTARTTNDPASSIILYRNPNHRTKPINYFATFCGLGKNRHPHSKHGPQMTLKQIADACVETYFSCWVRYKPVLRKDEFMAWYNSHPAPTETLIVNAICSFVFRHVVIHHSRPELSTFLADQHQLQEQEEFFFNRARDFLGLSFDNPDRFTIVSLLFMSCRAEPSKRHHYVGMAVSALLELDIYPRMVGDQDDSYDKEMDTRLWWFVWGIDFYLYSAGAPKNTPQTRLQGEIDLPRVFEEDIDEAEIGILTHAHCIKFWQMQAEMVLTLYEQDSDMTVEQLQQYDRRLLALYDALPPYLQFDSGFEYGCEDLFLACVRVNVEYNATRIILHKLFIPELNDTRPSRFSLESLNICVVTALTQLRALNTCIKSSGAIGRCAFDLDELWRAAEIISMSKDIYRTCESPIILNNVDKEEYDNALQKALEIVQQTRDFKAGSRDWIQVADWIQTEIRRHQLYSYPTLNSSSNATKRPDYFLANLKTKRHDATPPSSCRSESHHTMTPSGSMLSVLSFSSLSSTSSTSIFSPTTSRTPTQQQQRPSKNQPRFRYFNPRKMNKFLFIDENPSF